MSIIEKFGIKPVEVHKTSFESQIYPTAYCMPIDVEKLEQQRNKAIGAVVKRIKRIKPQTIHWMALCESEIEILKILTGKSQEEIKQIIDKER